VGGAVYEAFLAIGAKEPLDVIHGWLEALELVRRGIHRRVHGAYMLQRMVASKVARSMSLPGTGFSKIRQGQRST